MPPKVQRSIQQLRDAVAQQRKIGVYDATPRELPFGSWVWTCQDLHKPGEFGETNVLGVILDVEKFREGGAYHKGRMVRNYIVLTTEGQVACPREQLMAATPDEVRKEEGLSAETTFMACINEALKNGPSEANSLRFVAASKALLTLGKFVPNVILKGKW